MQSSTDLRSLLSRIDHRGYPAYKDTKGTYQFPGYVLSIDHVQGRSVCVSVEGQRSCEGKERSFPAGAL